VGPCIFCVFQMSCVGRLRHWVMMWSNRLSRTACGTEAPLDGRLYVGSEVPYHEGVMHRLVKELADFRADGVFPDAGPYRHVRFNGPGVTFDRSSRKKDVVYGG